MLKAFKEYQCYRTKDADCASPDSFSLLYIFNPRGKNDYIQDKIYSIHKLECWRYTYLPKKKVLFNLERKMYFSSIPEMYLKIVNDGYISC